MTVTITIPPAADAISVDAAKRHLRLEPEDTSMDGEIADLIRAATAAIETDTGLSLISRSVTYHVDRFSKRVFLPVWPVASVEEVRYVDAQGDAATMPSADYALAKSGMPKSLIFADHVPGIQVSEVPGSIEIDMIAGYGASDSDVPADLRQALKLLISHFDVNREAVIEGARRQELPIGVDRLISPFRVYR